MAGLDTSVKTLQGQVYSDKEHGYHYMIKINLISSAGGVTTAALLISGVDDLWRAQIEGSGKHIPLGGLVQQESAMSKERSIPMSFLSRLFGGSRSAEGQAPPYNKAIPSKQSVDMQKCNECGQALDERVSGQIAKFLDLK